MEELSTTYSGVSYPSIEEQEKYWIQKESEELQNKFGEPIVTRHKGAKFYCLVCGREYRKCKCKVYASVDALRDGKSTILRRKKEHPDT